MIEQDTIKLLRECEAGDRELFHRRRLRGAEAVYPQAHHANGHAPSPLPCLLHTLSERRESHARLRLLTMGRRGSENREDYGRFFVFPYSFKDVSLHCRGSMCCARPSRSNASLLYEGDQFFEGWQEEGAQGFFAGCDSGFSQRCE